MRHANLNCLGRYIFRASQPGEGLRPLRDPATADTDDDGGEESGNGRRSEGLAAMH
jgi:hypothetical protein